MTWSRSVKEIFALFYARLVLKHSGRLKYFKGQSDLWEILLKRSAPGWENYSLPLPVVIMVGILVI